MKEVWGKGRKVIEKTEMEKRKVIEKTDGKKRYWKNIIDRKREVIERKKTLLEECQ